jgi:hypothetical protein
MARSLPSRPVRLLVLQVRPGHRTELDCLAAHYPGLRQLPGDPVTVPLGDATPEEVLAACVALGLAVRGSAVRLERRTYRRGLAIDRPAPPPIGYAAR